MADDAELELPRGVALAWGVAADPQRGPKREMSVEKIVDAAVELADAEGLGAVSMAAVAAKLGYTPMSLYRYVSAKDDLVLLMQESATGVPPHSLRDVTGWRERLRAIFHAQLMIYLRASVDARHPHHRLAHHAQQLGLDGRDARRAERHPLTEEERMAVTLLVTGHVRWYGNDPGRVLRRVAELGSHARADHRAGGGDLRVAHHGRGVPRSPACGGSGRVPRARRTRSPSDSSGSSTGSPRTPRRSRPGGRTIRTGRGRRSPARTWPPTSACAKPAKPYERPRKPCATHRSSNASRSVTPGTGSPARPRDRHSFCPAVTRVYSRPSNPIE